MFWKLFDMRPEKLSLSPIPNCGLVHVEATVQAIVEVIHAFMLVDPANIPFAAQLFMKLLLCHDTQVSFGAKQSIIRVLRPKSRRRKVQLPAPAVAEATSAADTNVKATTASVSSLASSGGAAHQDSRQGSLDVFVENPGNYYAAPDPAGAENLVAVDDIIDVVGGQFPAAVMDLVGEGDDEAMVELAIALSLQEQNADENQVAGLLAVNPAAMLAEAGNAAAAAAAAAVANVPAQGRGSMDDRGHYSDTTASPAASDDEGSTAATDGSTLRTSPVPNEAAVADNGSESGGSPVESIIGENQVTSGRSSAYGEDGAVALASGGATPATRAQSREVPDSTTTSVDPDDLDASNAKLHQIRIILLECLIESLPEVRQVGGVHCIPFMQVMLMLSSDLDSGTDGERDRQAMSLLLNSLLGELQFDGSNRMTERTPNHEVKLIIMRLLSILMSRVKSSSSSKEASTLPGQYATTLTAQTLISSNILDLCLDMLVTLLGYWKQTVEEDVDVQTGRGSNQSATLHVQSNTSPPDMSPFFLRQYVRGHADDVFELYPQLLTEMVLRLPYQIKKISNTLAAQAASQGRQQHMPPSVTFSSAWLEHLCEYMMSPLTPYVKKQVRKLLSYICSSKERYRQIRDFHALDSHLTRIIETCRAAGFVEQTHSGTSSNTNISLNYDQTIALIERLKACSEIAGSRMANWQRYCHKHPSILPFFVQIR